MRPGGGLSWPWPRTFTGPRLRVTGMRSARHSSRSQRCAVRPSDVGTVPALVNPGQDDFPPWDAYPEIAGALVHRGAPEPDLFRRHTMGELLDLLGDFTWDVRGVLVRPTYGM